VVIAIAPTTLPTIVLWNINLNKFIKLWQLELSIQKAMHNFKSKIELTKWYLQKMSYKIFWKIFEIAQNKKKDCLRWRARLFFKMLIKAMMRWEMFLIFFKIFNRLNKILVPIILFLQTNFLLLDIQSKKHNKCNSF